MSDGRRSTKGSPAGDTSDGFTAAEKAAMKERARELKAEANADRKREDGQRDLLAKVAELPEPDRSMAERIHVIVTAAAPELMPRTWYGMPAYARDGKIVCFFQPASKFGARYSTVGFDQAAHLDEGEMWPTAFAVTSLTEGVEARIGELVRKAVG